MEERPSNGKQLQVEADVPELIARRGLYLGSLELDHVVGDMMLIAFYYLLHIREYTVKSTHNKTKQTIQFKFEDVTFFKKNVLGHFCCLRCNAEDTLIAIADGARLKLDNQRNGWKGICIYQEANRDPFLCPVWAIGRWYLHLRTHCETPKTYLSTY